MESKEELTEEEQERGARLKIWLDYNEIFSMGISDILKTKLESFPVWFELKDKYINEKETDVFSSIDCPAGRQTIETVLDCVKRSLSIESAILEPDDTSEDRDPVSGEIVIRIGEHDHEWCCNPSPLGQDLQKFLTEAPGRLPVKRNINLSYLQEVLKRHWGLDHGTHIQEMDFAVQLVSLLQPGEMEIALLAVQEGQVGYKFKEICGEIDALVLEWINKRQETKKQAHKAKKAGRKCWKDGDKERLRTFFIYRYAIWKHLIAAPMSPDLRDRIKAAKIAKAEEEADVSRAWAEYHAQIQKEIRMDREKTTKAVNG